MECLSPVGRTLDDTKFLSLIESNVKAGTGVGWFFLVKRSFGLRSDTLKNVGRFSRCKFGPRVFKFLSHGAPIFAHIFNFKSLQTQFKT